MRMGCVWVETVARQYLLPEAHDLRNYIANVNVVTANSRSGRNGSAAHGNRLRGTAQTSACHRIKRPGLQACRPIKQNVVPDHVLEKQTNAAAYNGLAVLVGVPGESELRREIQVRLSDSVSISWKRCVDVGICRQIAVRSTCITIVTQPKAQSEIWFDLP